MIPPADFMMQLACSWSCQIFSFHHTMWGIKVKTFNHGLIWPQHLLLHLLSATWLMTNSKQGFLWLSTMTFFLPLIRKGQICGVHNYRFSWGQIVPPELWVSAAPPVTVGLLLVSLTLTWHTLLGGQFCLGRFVVVPHSTFPDDGFDRPAWDVHLGIFFNSLTILYVSPQLYPWPAWRAVWSSWSCLFGNVL